MTLGVSQDGLDAVLGYLELFGDFLGGHSVGRVIHDGVYRQPSAAKNG